MAVSPQSNEAFLREVDDAVRQDRMVGFWTRYGRWVIGAIVAGLIALAGWLYWDHRSTQAAGATAEELGKLLDTVVAGGTPNAAQLQAIADADQPGYRAAAQLTKAAVAAQKGDRAGAIALYKAMAADGALDQPYRDLALVRQTALEFDGLKPADIVARLKPLAVAGDPWFGSAGEMTAIAYMKMGKPDLAGPIFAAVAKDAQVPETIRSRARQMAGLLGIDAIEDNKDGGTDAQ
ncbi:tetratricopeptide repeat protein [Sphingobium algorifonticola]|uniref:Tetratricopeptide repeat protein n=1 Tax=Sphingobium algorifonticola TaxID=2008318 RepID=A0A437JDJ5_9SPHN|nr:tetratricopeptide repeat protein [Sphingobium algorifonticola]RVT43999.1 tetratricopeptide repeat protein [Sphingobium algorifonticola]